MGTDTGAFPPHSQEVRVSVPIRVGASEGAREILFQLRAGEDFDAGVVEVLKAVSAELEKERGRMPIDVPVQVHVDNAEAHNPASSHMIRLTSSEDSVVRAVAAFSAEHALRWDVDQIRKLEFEVVSHLRRHGLLRPPLIEVPLILDGHEASMPVFANEPLSFSVSLFAQEHGLQHDARDLLEQEAARTLAQRGLLPIAALDISMTTPSAAGDAGAAEAGGKKETHRRTLFMYANDTVSGAVSRFMTRERIHDTDGSVTNDLITMLVREGRRMGLIPITQVPVFIDSQRFELPVYASSSQQLHYGDTDAGAHADGSEGDHTQGHDAMDGHTISFAASRAVDKFAAEHGIATDESQLARLREGVMAHLQTEGLAPAIEIPVTFIDEGHKQSNDNNEENPGSERRVQFPLYRKQDIGAQMDAFVVDNELTEPAATEFRVQVQQRLIAVGLLPRAVFPVTVDGKPLQVELFEGESIEAAAEAFLRNNLTNGDDPRELQQLVPELVRQLYAQYGAVSVPVTLGEDGRVEHLTYKHGESLKDVVRDFCTRHGVVDPGAIQHLEAGLRARVFSQRTT